MRTEYVSTYVLYKLYSYSWLTIFYVRVHVFVHLLRNLQRMLFIYTEIQQNLTFNIETHELNVF